MSSEESTIVCRRCNETFRVEDENCPNCGKAVRSTAYLAGGFVLGVVIAVASLFDPGQLAFFGVFGLAIAVTTGYLLYNKRNRIDQTTDSEGDVDDIFSEDDSGL